MATMKQVFGAMKKGLSTGNFTLNGLVQTLQNYCEQLENSTGGGGGGSTVTYTQTATSGGECGTINIDGDATKIYAPLQNAAGVGYDNSSSGLTADDVQEAIDELNTKEGDLDDLTTTAKSSLVAAINEAAQSGGGGSYTLIGSETGTTAIAIPAGKSEIMAIVKINNLDTQIIPINILTAYLSSTAQKLRAGYYNSASSNAGISINISDSSINLQVAYHDGTDETSASVITVYAK